MICSIGAFIFEAQDVMNMDETITPHFGEYRPIGDDPHYHATQGSVEEVTIGGKYIADANSKPEIIKGIARAKRSVRFTTATGQSMKVIITKVSVSKKAFLPYSGAVKIDFTITMKKAGGGFSIFGILGGILALF